MSRTDKTDPLDVKMWDRFNKGIGIEENHDHSKGECDLPKTYQEYRKRSWPNKDWFKYNCAWTWTYLGKHVCCCSLCHKNHWTEDKAADNNSSRMELRDMVKLYNAGQPLD